MTKLDLINKIKKEEATKKHNRQMDRARELLKKTKEKENNGLVQ